MAIDVIRGTGDTLPSTAIAPVRQLGPGRPRRPVSDAAHGRNPTDLHLLNSYGRAGAFYPPRRSTTDFLWIVVVVAFAIVLVGSFATIAVSVFVGVRDTAIVQTVLSLFTAVVGFLGGLFIPTPSAARGGQITTQTSAPADAEIQTDVRGHAATDTDSSRTSGETRQ